MDLADFFIELAKCFVSVRPDNYRSVVGESPLEARMGRFWRLVQALLALTAIGCAVWYWLH